MLLASNTQASAVFCLFSLFRGSKNVYAVILLCLQSFNAQNYTLFKTSGSGLFLSFANVSLDIVIKYTFYKKEKVYSRSTLAKIVEN